MEACSSQADVTSWSSPGCPARGAPRPLTTSKTSAGSWSTTSRRAHREGRRARRRPRVEHRAPGPGGRQRHPPGRHPRGDRTAAVGRPPGPGAVPRGGHAGAGQPVRQHPAQAPALRRQPERARPIEQERELLEPVRAMADLVVDTTDLNVHQLKARLRRRVRSGGLRGRRCRRRSRRSGTSTACPSTSTSCSTAASCPTPTGWRACATSPGWTTTVREYVLGNSLTQDFLGPARRPARPPAAGLRRRGQELPHDRLRLYGRPAPLGRDRRRGRQPAGPAGPDAAAPAPGPARRALIRTGSARGTRRH